MTPENKAFSRKNAAAGLKQLKRSIDGLLTNIASPHANANMKSAHKLLSSYVKKNNMAYALHTTPMDAYLIAAISNRLFMALFPTDSISDYLILRYESPDTNPRDLLTASKTKAERSHLESKHLISSSLNTCASQYAESWSSMLHGSSAATFDSLSFTVSELVEKINYLKQNQMLANQFMGCPLVQKQLNSILFLFVCLCSAFWNWPSSSRLPLAGLDIFLDGLASVLIATLPLLFVNKRNLSEFAAATALILCFYGMGQYISLISDRVDNIFTIRMLKSIISHIEKHEPGINNTVQQLKAIAQEKITSHYKSCATSTVESILQDYAKKKQSNPSENKINPTTVAIKLLVDQVYDTYNKYKISLPEYVVLIIIFNELNIKNIYVSEAFGAASSMDDKRDHKKTFKTMQQINHSKHSNAQCRYYSVKPFDCNFVRGSLPLIFRAETGSNKTVEHTFQKLEREVKSIVEDFTIRTLSLQNHATPT